MPADPTPVLFRLAGAGGASGRFALPIPGRGAVWLARLTGGQEVGGSNPLGPTGTNAGRGPLIEGAPDPRLQSCLRRFGTRRRRVRGPELELPVTSSRRQLPAPLASARTRGAVAPALSLAWDRDWARGDLRGRPAAGSGAGRRTRRTGRGPGAARRTRSGRRGWRAGRWRPGSRPPS